MACKSGPSPSGAQPDAGVVPSALAHEGRALATEALQRARSAGSGCLDRARYLALRKAVAASLASLRYVASGATEVIVGPPVIMSEAAGRLAALDGALTANACGEVAGHVFQITRALEVIDFELSREGPTRRAVIHGLSDAAYDLGAEALESTAGTPEGSDAVLADLQGTLEGIARGVRAYGVDVKLPSRDAEVCVAELVKKLDDGRESFGPPATTPGSTFDRGSFAVTTGRLGAAIRALGRASGVDASPPYAALHSTDNVNALTLPKPHFDPEPKGVAIGARLFADRKLSRGGVRACTACHDPAMAWADGRIVPRSLDPSTILGRNTPSLLYSPIAAVLHWDGRFRTADAQALNVIHAKAEMGLPATELLRVLREAYEREFAEAFSDGLTERNVGRALAMYEASVLVPANAPIDRYSLGDAEALTADQQKGLGVFAGKGRCARCHTPPTFGGARPPDFTAPIYAALGVPLRPSTKVFDGDLGRFAVTQRSGDKRAFRTPTLRNVRATAPYFHHGAFATLESVLTFYDKGGGRAIGLEVPNQDPDVRPLALTAEEKRVLLTFLREGLSDLARAD